MTPINTIEKFHQFLNSLDNVSVDTDNLNCHIYLGNSIIARGKRVSNDANQYEIFDSQQPGKHNQIEEFFFTENKIFYRGSYELLIASGDINEFIEYLFDKYPSMEPLEYLAEKQSNELGYNIRQLTEKIIELRIENNKTKEELIKNVTELYKTQTRNKKYEDEIQELKNTAAEKEKLIIPAFQYFVKELSCVSLSQYNSICTYEKKHPEAMNNKTICVYENDLVVSFSFNPLIYINFQDKDLVGLPITEVSSERIVVLFDKKGDQVFNLNFTLFNKRFELDWETFKQLQFR